MKVRKLCRMRVTIYNTTNSAQGFPFPQLQHLLSSDSFIMVTSNKCMIVLCYLLCNYLMTGDVEYCWSFLYLFIKMFFSVLHPFLNGDICLFVSAIDFYVFFIYFRYQALISYVVCTCTFPFHWLCFYFVDGFICWAVAFQFDAVPLLNFCAFCLCFKNDSQKKHY